MALSYVEYPSDGTTRAFDLTFGYLHRSHVFAFVNDQLVAYTWVSGTRIQLVTAVGAPQAPVTVRLRRLTDRANRITNFSDGQTLLAGDLNAGDLQNFFILQEIADGITDGVLAGTINVDGPGGYITEQWIQEQLEASIGGSSALQQLSNLIQAEVTDRNEALLAEAQARAADLLAEAQARIAAVNAEVAARVSAVQAEANARLAEAATIRDNLTAEVSARVGGLSGLNAQIVSEASTRLSADGALSTRIDAVVASDASNYALIVAEQTARANADTAEATARGLLAARVTTAEGGLTSVNANLVTESAARVSGDNAAASRLNALEATVNTATTGLSARLATAESTITDYATSKASASALSTLQTEVTNARNGAASIKARIDGVESASSTADTAAASRLNALEATVDTASTGLSAKVAQLLTTTTNLSTNKADASVVTAINTRVGTAESNITGLQSSVVDLSANKASAASVSSLGTRMGSAESNITGLQSSVTSLSGSKADATALTALSSTVSGHTSSITSLQATVVDLAANKAESSALTSVQASLQSALGSGVNLLPNSGWEGAFPAAGGTLAATPSPIWYFFKNDGNNRFNPFALGSSYFSSQVVPPFGGIELHQAADGSYGGSQYLGFETLKVPVVGGKTYMASIYVGAGASLGSMYMKWYDAAGGALTGSGAFASFPTSNGGGSYLAAWNRWYYAEVAPATAAFATFTFYRTGSNSGSATVTTIMLPMIEEIRAGQTRPSPWSPGRNDANSASVSSLQYALATNNSSQARLLLKVNTTTNVATIEAYAASGDGVWNGSVVKLAANTIQLLASQILFGSNTAFEDTYNTFYTTYASKRNRWGGPFGASGDLMEWFGPTTVALNAETKTNGYWAKGTDGKMYYGASELGISQFVVSVSNRSPTATRGSTGTITTPAITVGVSGGVGSIQTFWRDVSSTYGGPDAGPTTRGGTDDYHPTFSVTRSYSPGSGDVFIEPAWQFTAIDSRGSVATCIVSPVLTYH